MELHARKIQLPEPEDTTMHQVGMLNFINSVFCFPFISPLHAFYDH